MQYEGTITFIGEIETVGQNALQKRTVVLEEVTDREGNQINKSFFLLQIQSMSEVDDFWLDSGIFSLSINNK